MKQILVAIGMLIVGTSFGQEPNKATPDTVTMTDPTVTKIIDSIPFNPGDSIFDYPDVDARFTGGAPALLAYIRENVRYPEFSLKNEEQGRVYVLFVVEKDGAITNIEIMRGGISESIDQEAIRLVQGMPHWIPAEVKGVPVRSKNRLPITFTL